MEHGLKTYEQYSVKEDRSGNLMEQDGIPVLGELINSFRRLDDSTALLLNKNWKNFRIYYVLVDDKKQPEKLKESDGFIAETFIKSAKKEDFINLKESELKSAFDLMSKAALIEMIGISCDPKKINATPRETFITNAKEIINN